MSDFTANFKVRGVSHKGAINIFVSDISYVIIDKNILIPWQWELIQRCSRTEIDIKSYIAIKIISIENDIAL